MTQKKKFLDRAKQDLSVSSAKIRGCYEKEKAEMEQI